MFLLGILIHVTFLFSIFDIYFKSPIVPNVVPYEPTHAPVADRLVLFMVDGLRAESFVNYTTMPYLRSVANSHGRWGISNTRVPTESRPGHVAVIAGFYEDPSAVAKGWKENPVDFDSVFNQTKYTWSWGTYDILEIFTKGSASDHISAHKLDPYDQTFSTDKNTTLLDDWVFVKVKDFFAKASSDPVLYEKLHKKKIAFFLHLLGTDTSGHTHKPKTQNFLTTIRFVDENIREIEEIIRQFYGNDGKTTFLMTSDHGMTDWGSHGSGDEHETQTPYVLWGSGVQQFKDGTIDPSTKGMSLGHRQDISQADLTPLMSTILSIPVPVNSIGRLPQDLLNMTLQNKAAAIYSNSRQLASQYDKKRSDVEAHAIPLLYYPYEPLTKKKYEQFIKFTDKLLMAEEYEKLILFSEEIMQLSLSGLTYYHNYYQRPLLVLVTLSFMGWIVNLLKLLLEQKVNTQIDSSDMKMRSTKDIKVMCNLFVNSLFSVVFFVMTFLVYVQNLPVQYYLYFLLPVMLWWNVASFPTTWIRIYDDLNKSGQVSVVWIEIFCYSVGSLAMGLSFTYRWMLSIPLLGMAIWPLFASRNHLRNSLLISWIVSCFILILFSFMPVIGKDVFIELVLSAGVVWLIIMGIYIRKILLCLYHDNEEHKREIVFTTIQMVFLVLSLHNIYVQSNRFENGTPVSLLYQSLAWIIAIASLIIPLLHTRRVVCRLMAINTSLLTFYLLLSVSHEGLFMVALIFNVSCWIYIEYKLMNLGNSTQKFLNYKFGADIDTNDNSNGFVKLERSITKQDFRRAFFFTLYIILAFFGTGNIASLNSFEVRWVTCFITSFQPFIITTLILLKTLSPFLAVACGFGAIQYLTKAPTGYLNIIVLIYSNIMGLQLLYNVKNTGSWLEIGTSISQFVIVQVITVFIVLINQIGKILTDVNLYIVAHKVFKSRKKYV